MESRGLGKSLEGEIATDEGFRMLQQNDVQLILRINFLAQKLKEAIVLGHQPRHMRLADLMQNIPSL